MRQARALTLTLTLTLTGALERVAWAGAPVAVARAGDTVETLAAEYYGNRALAFYIVEANQIPRDKPLAAGQRVRIPSTARYRLKRGETLESVAARILEDKRRAPFLAQWSGLPKGERGREGTEVVLPFQFWRRGPESLANLAKAFYGDAGQAKFLQAYNFRSSPTLGKSDRVAIPIVHLKVRAVRLEPPPAQAGAPKPEKHDDAEAREAELAARVAARLAEAEKSYRDGNYDDVPAALTKLLSEEDPSEAQLIAIHRLLAFAYVALGADEVAVKEFREVIERDPAAELDAALVSPKIRAAFARARAAK